jgi:transposase
MPFPSTKATLALDPDAAHTLESLCRSRTESRARVDRAGVLLAYAEGQSVAAIARRGSMSRSAVNRIVNRALEAGPLAALEDLARVGRPRRLTTQARAWVVALVCQQPKDVGYPHELWTIDLLGRHIRDHCRAAGHPSLASLAGGTISKILTQHKVRPHKIRYYLERRDPDFDAKMVQILLVYEDVALTRETADEDLTVVISYDERPGIQAIESKRPGPAAGAGETSDTGPRIRVHPAWHQ